MGPLVNNLVSATVGSHEQNLENLSYLSRSQENSKNLANVTNFEHNFKFTE